MLARTVTPNEVYEALSEEIRYWKRKYGYPFTVTTGDEHQKEQQEQLEDSGEQQDSDIDSDIQVLTDTDVILRNIAFLWSKFFQS